jgi:hypothetical protein
MMEGLLQPRHLAVILACLLLVLAGLIPSWQICKKAGFAPALSLLMLVPVANLVLPLFLAFADWPALKKAE